MQLDFSIYETLKSNQVVSNKSVCKIVFDEFYKMYDAWVVNFNCLSRVKEYRKTIPSDFKSENKIKLRYSSIDDKTSYTSPTFEFRFLIDKKLLIIFKYQTWHYYSSAPTCPQGYINNDRFDYLDGLVVSFVEVTVDTDERIIFNDKERNTRRYYFSFAYDEICIKTSESKALSYTDFHSKYYYWFNSYFHKRNLIKE